MNMNAPPCCATGCSLAIRSWPAAPTCPPRCDLWGFLSARTLALSYKATNTCPVAPNKHALPRILPPYGSGLKCPTHFTAHVHRS